MGGICAKLPAGIVILPHMEYQLDMSPPRAPAYREIHSMHPFKYFVAAGLLLVMEAVGAEAGAICDATVVTGACQASVAVDGNAFVIRTDSRNCARVEWEAGGVRRSTTVVDGQVRLEIPGSKARKAVVSTCAGIKDLRPGTGVEDAATHVRFAAKCTFDGNPAVIESLTIEGNFSTMESRVAAAHEACQPIIQRASATCSLDKATIQAELDALVSDYTQRSRRAYLREQLKLVEGPRPAYCQ